MSRSVQSGPEQTRVAVQLIFKHVYNFHDNHDLFQKSPDHDFNTTNEDMHIAPVCNTDRESVKVPLGLPKRSIDVKHPTHHHSS